MYNLEIKDSFDCQDPLDLADLAHDHYMTEMYEIN